MKYRPYVFAGEGREGAATPAANLRPEPRKSWVSFRSTVCVEGGDPRGLLGQLAMGYGVAPSLFGG